MKDNYSIYKHQLAFAILIMEASPAVFLLTKRGITYCLIANIIAKLHGSSWVNQVLLSSSALFPCFIAFSVLYDVSAFSYFLVLHVSILQWLAPSSITLNRMAQPGCQFSYQLIIALLCKQVIQSSSLQLMFSCC